MSCNGRNSAGTKVALQVAVCSLLAAGHATAQEATGDTAGASELDALMAEVVVTARKREESLQDAPIAISAFSGESLAVRGATTIADVGAIVPNLTYQNNPGSSGASSVATVYIRGVGQRDFLGTLDNGVGFYIDDVYIARTIGATVELLDVARIEVLRGPQGTLFGRNSVGGAIKLHSRDPAREFGGYAEATYGTDDLVKLRGTINVPITDTFRTSFSAIYSTQDGYVDRPAGGDLGNDDTVAVRGGFLWEPTDTVVVRLTADYSTEDENGAAFQLKDAGALVPGGFPGFHNNFVARASCAYPGGITSTNPACYNNQWVSDKNLGTSPTYSKVDVWGTTASIEWRLADAVTLKSITAYRDLDAEFARDADASPLSIVAYYDSFDVEQVSQEVQLLTSLFDKKLDLITGLYYFDEDGKNVNRLDFAIASLTSGGGFGTKSKAAFAQGTYHVTEQLDLTVGLRYTDEKKTFDPRQTVGPNLIGIPYPSAAGDACLVQNERINVANGTPGLITQIPATSCPVPILPFGKVKASTSKVTPMVNAAYRFNTGLMAYATYSEGFRSGGFVQRIFPPLPFVPHFGPEYVKSYELGFKYSNEGNTFSLNGAGFFMDYTDIQVRTQIPGFVGFAEGNAGDAEISGFELESRWKPARSWFVEAAVGYTDAKYTKIRVTPPLVAQVNLDSKFDHVPKWTLSGGLSKEFDLGTAGSLTTRVNVSYHSSYFNNPENLAVTRTPAVDIWDAGMIWRSPGEAMTVNLGVKNFTNEKYLVTGFLNPTMGVTEVMYDRGRQWSLSVRYDF